MRGRPFGSAVGTVEVHRRRRIGSTPRPIIPSVDPAPAGLGAATTRIEYRGWRVVGNQLGGAKQRGGEPLPQWLQPPRRSSHPVRQGRTVQLDALTGENLG